MKLLLIDHLPGGLEQQLSALGHPLTYLPDATREEVLAAVHDADILVMNSKVNADAALLAAGPRLKMICRAGVGMDHFDLPLLASKGIVAFNTPGANATAVGEQTLGMLLALLNRIVQADRQVRQFKWLREENRGTELAGKTVGIIGFGHTGQAFGRTLAGFGCRVLAYDKYRPHYGRGHDAGQDHVQASSIAAIQAEADVLSLHIPLTDETEGWIDADFLAAFQHPIYLLNLARGPIVPLAGLVTALAQGDVVAAALDVLENEKLHTLHPAQRMAMETLIATDQVIFTPHIGGWSHESLQRINARIVAAITDFIAQHA
jgi:D-3-phosphoglycerate dehydrogenase / 2-oxoglutarate reductase